MHLSDLIVRLWKEDKLLLFLLVFMAGLLVWSVFQFPDDYHREGWWAALLPGICGYALFRILQIARLRVPTLGESTTADEDKRMGRVLRKGSKQEFDELVAEEGPKQEAHRRTLWAEAVSSLKTARQLQREIQVELTTLDDIMGSMAKHAPVDRKGMQDLALYRKEVEQELERVVELIRHHRG